jgi:5-methylcytosine-specific restriction enzyme A
MPWKPASVGKQRTPYDERWKRIRAQKLQSEPLCRLCLSAGRTVSATVVDHIIPLAEGGTHDTANLQPLCKRCHDAIKTPADVAARKRAESVGLQIIAVAFGVEFAGAGVMDQRAIRRIFASGMDWQAAHTVSLAAMDGIVAAARAGALPRLKSVIVTDDARWARMIASLLGVEACVQPMNIDPPSVDGGAEMAWLRERYGSERDARSAPSVGTQAETTLLG